MCLPVDSTFSIVVLCPNCGSNVRKVNGTTNNLTLAIAILECTSCAWEGELSTSLRQMERYKTSWDHKQERATA